MENGNQTDRQSFYTIEDPALAMALNELGRSINLVATYGKNHLAAQTAIAATTDAMQNLFADRKSLLIGAFNGVMTIDEKTVMTTGTLQKSLERRLVRLRITGLKLSPGISQEELIQLAELIAKNDADQFQQNLSKSGLSHIHSENTLYQAMHQGRAVADESALGGIGRGKVLVLEDDAEEEAETQHGSAEPHVQQNVAFLKGDLGADSGNAGKELSKMASDPDRLGRIIIEAVAIRQSATELSGESLGDLVLGCLRRTYDGLRNQPVFRTAEGKADLKNSLLPLEESLLGKMRALTGEDNPELDRRIVKTIQEMDENLSFEIAAAQYMEHRKAIENTKEQLHHFVRTQGAQVAENLLHGSGFPISDWRKIVMESGISAENAIPKINDGLSTLTSLFEQLEHLMRSQHTDGAQVKNLLGQANKNLEGNLGTTREKLAVLSSTIGGQARNMPRSELLAALAEVAQELMQPLTAVNASLEMMLHGYVGGISAEQEDLLTLASHSGEHLKYLMDTLIDIVGCPANKGIDNRFHTTSDQVVQMMKEADDAEGQEHLPLFFP